jgi:hypothetical protein
VHRRDLAPVGDVIQRIRVEDQQARALIGSGCILNVQVFERLLTYPNTAPTMADSLTGRETLTVVPAEFRKTTLLNVTVARGPERPAGGDISIETVPATARHTSGSIEPSSRRMTSVQKLKCR